jgi:hypothetical protein
MTIRSIDVKRFSAISQRPFTDVLATIDVAIGHPDANALRHLATASTYAELESVARSNVGPTDLLELMRFDHRGNPTQGQRTRRPKQRAAHRGQPIDHETNG